ncbi:hypothetical protein CRP01_16000 [Flavilitoribacter nigricans DSM 23189 = NBRC 102662]|uniref:Uncharacterized protein n=1 Tax=Flavilitoribacter nigricans (strain ATCC 23147 / DSM 23189 / NBRC 102662 / NCIMB 1420 / SS-2) TaxID=1122177 RepID=A0A2D0NAI5_FLAN2|nr:hypothetical protein CRP01_16000 [Flavilitoribacter nigricans DSM 23189 = NBRC 102662]
MARFTMASKITSVKDYSRQFVLNNNHQIMQDRREMIKKALSEQINLLGVYRRVSLIVFRYKMYYIQNNVLISRDQPLFRIF